MMKILLYNHLVSNLTVKLAVNSLNWAVNSLDWLLTA